MSADISLAGRTMLVTGASSGIGAHIGRVAAQSGAAVVLCARRIERTEILAQDLRASGCSVIALPMDVTNERSVVDAYDAAEKTLGTINTIIANAGVSNAGRSTDISRDDVRAVIDTNLLGVYLTVREGAKRLIRSPCVEKHGRIVLIGSITAEMTNQGDAAYAATKAGVAHLGRQFAREWVRQDINVNTVQPGYIRTELSKTWFETEAGVRQVEGWHRRRLMDIDALDDLILHLCSSHSRYLTGGTFTIDDGQSL